MTGNEILGPFLAMVLLTVIVWLVMYWRRLNYIFRHRIDAQQLTIPEKGAALLPEQVNWPAYNLKNLFELPVLFYALCLYLYVSQSVDPVFVCSGWAFVGLRAAHSLVHCTVNIVKLRFAAYLLSSLVLWFMAVRASWQFIDGMI